MDREQTRDTDLPCYIDKVVSPSSSWVDTQQELVKRSHNHRLTSLQVWMCVRWGVWMCGCVEVWMCGCRCVDV